MATRANKMNWTKGFNEEEKNPIFGEPASMNAAPRKPGNRVDPTVEEEANDFYDDDSAAPAMEDEETLPRSAMSASRKKTAKNRAVQRPVGGNKRMTK